MPIFSSGMALSANPISGSHNESNRKIFDDSRLTGDSAGSYAVAVQGFYWSGTATLTVNDFNGVTLFRRAGSPMIRPNTASGSIGLVCTAPFRISSTGAAGGGGRLIVYGQVL